MPITISDIDRASERIAGKIRRTPILQSDLLDKIAGRRILIKPECLQHTGSFKFRGACSAISALDDTTRSRGIIAFSSGNHAQGIAKVSAMYRVPAVIVMPADAPIAKIEGTRGYGAEVVLYDRATEDRDAIGADLAKKRGLTLVKPFDEPMVIAGQGTTGLEIAEQVAEFDIAEADVIVPCGGGGLTSGIAIALNARAPNLRVRPAEPEGFDDVARSLKSGKIERNATLSGSICDAIITPQPGDLTFPIMHDLCAGGLVVTADECEHAMALAYAHHNIVIEPGGAVGLAACLFHGSEIKGDTVICVASGGNVDATQFITALNKYGTTQ